MPPISAWELCFILASQKSTLNANQYHNVQCHHTWENGYYPKDQKQTRIGETEEKIEACVLEISSEG